MLDQNTLISETKMSGKISPWIFHEINVMKFGQNNENTKGSAYDKGSTGNSPNNFNKE